MKKMDEMDRILLHEEAIVPSSGFALSVMEAVKAEAEASSPLAFPWMRALPVLAAVAVTMVLLVAMIVKGAVVDTYAAVRMPEIAAPGNGSWIALGVAVSAVSMFFSLRPAWKR